MAFKQNIIALVYDFDGTLSPKPMQEYTILPELGENPTEFWQKCKLQAKQHHADMMLTYMRLLIEEINHKNIKLDKSSLANLANKIEYFPGVSQWFSNINTYVSSRFNNEVQVEHYIISAGLKEILDGVSIKDEFTQIFASEYYVDAYGKAQFPTIVVNDTAKTQYLFRINKGIFDINDSINQHMANADRRIPFSNILYFGDGETDVPSMTVTKNNGGYALAVHKEEIKAEEKEVYTKLLNAGRIDYFTPANYSKGSDLEHKVKLIINKIGADILLQKEKYQFASTL